MTAEILVSKEKLKFHNTIFINTQNEEFKTFLGAMDSCTKESPKGMMLINRWVQQTRIFLKLPGVLLIIQM